MNERERIELLMKSYNLSPSQFADRTGIQRASVSHILSGRNKPSLEIMLKIYDSFPGLDMKWLMTGSGTVPSPTNSVQDNVVQNTLFDNGVNGNVVLDVHPSSVVQESGVLHQEHTMPVQAKQTSSRQPRKHSSVRNASMPAGNLAKSIKEVRIYYTDGTYETLIPEKS